jgi:hypothetical protein
LTVQKYLVSAAIVSSTLPSSISRPIAINPVDKSLIVVIEPSVGVRTMKLMRGGKRAQREAELMVREKMDAALDAAAKLMAGPAMRSFADTAGAWPQMPNGSLVPTFLGS